jgi:hypothetical protein
MTTTSTATTRTATQANDRKESRQTLDPRPAAQELASTLRSAASDATNRVPEAASSTYDALVGAGRAIRSGNDESLTGGTILSFGLAIGLLVGRANRLLVLAALIPAGAMGAQLLERAAQTRVRADKRSS